MYITGYPKITAALYSKDEINMISRKEVMWNVFSFQVISCQRFFLIRDETALPNLMEFW